MPHSMCRQLIRPISAGRSLLTMAVVAFLPACGSPPSQPATTSHGGEHLTTGEALSADPDELRQDLLLQLQDRTGRFINLLDGEIGVVLRARDLTNAQRSWLRTMRTDATQGILWAIQQEDVVDSEIETLFFSRLLHRLKSEQAVAIFDATSAKSIDDMLQRAEDIFWTPVRDTLGDWAVRIESAADQFAAHHPDTPSIAFASSDLYVVADDTAHANLIDLFGLDARLELAAQGIGYLNQTADRAVFLAEFLPRLLTMYGESALGDLIDGINTGDLALLPAQLSKIADSLRSALAERQEALAMSLHDAAERLQVALTGLDSDLARHISSVDDAISQQVEVLATRLDRLNESGEQLALAMGSLEEDIEQLAANVDRLAASIEQIPEDIAATLADPPPATAKFLEAAERRFGWSIGLMIIGAMVGSVLASTVVLLLGLRMRSPRA